MGGPVKLDPPGEDRPVTVARRDGEALTQNPGSRLTPS
jgi:hypothetical protein